MGIGKISSALNKVENTFSSAKKDLIGTVKDNKKTLLPFALTPLGAPIANYLTPIVSGGTDMGATSNSFSSGSALSNIIDTVGKIGSNPIAPFAIAGGTSMEVLPTQKNDYLFGGNADYQGKQDLINEQNRIAEENRIIDNKLKQNDIIFGYGGSPLAKYNMARINFNKQQIENDIMREAGLKASSLYGNQVMQLNPQVTSSLGGAIQQGYKQNIATASNLANQGGQQYINNLSNQRNVFRDAIINSQTDTSELERMKNDFNNANKFGNIATQIVGGFLPTSANVFGGIMARS